MTKITRTTKETDITVEIGNTPEVATPLPMLTHVVETLGRYAGIRLRVRAQSRDHLDHHLIEDVAITLGAALQKAFEPGTRQRFGQRLIPMDEALVAAALDMGGRPYYAGGLPDAMWDHFLRSLAFEARWTLHVEVRRAGESHHVVEAAVKAVGLALREALVPTTTVQSTKGKVRTRGR